MVALACVGLLPSLPVRAAPLNLLVNHPGDAGTSSTATSGDIRYVINTANANPGSTITFDTAATGATITLTHGALTLLANMTITGPGANVQAVDGNNNGSVFTIGSNSVTATLNGLTIQHGSGNGTGCAPASTCGGGINNDAGGTLTVTNCTITSNTVTLAAAAASSTAAAR